MSETSGTTAAADREAIRQVVQDYIAGWYSADAERVAGSFHPDMAKRGIQVHPQSGRAFVTHLTATMMAEMTRAGGGRDVPGGEQFEITVFAVDRDIASAKVVSAEYVDYVHLARIDGRWSIVNVLWQRHASPPAPQEEPGRSTAG